MELLIAVAILVTVMMSTMLIFRGISRAWQTGQLRTERYQQARLLFDLFARELSSCVVNARYPFLGNNIGANSGNNAPPGHPLKPGSTQDELFFVGALPGRAGLVERGYWVNGNGELMCHDKEPADGDYATGGLDESCGHDIVMLDISYFDGTAWLVQWDGRPGGAQEGRIPKALHIALTISAHHGEQFETVIVLPTS